MKNFLPLGQERRKEVLESKRVTHHASDVKLTGMVVLDFLNKTLALGFSKQAIAKVSRS